MRNTSWIMGLVLVLGVAGFAAAEDAPEVRAMWVTRYDYETEADVRQIVKRCAELGANRILFQVRGNGSVFYPSKLEPWSALLASKDPGFDPLAVALAEAQARKLKLEAWINVMPLWKGTRPPKDPKHPFLLHPEWLVMGSDKKPQRLNAHYVCANPARADVRMHVAAVAAEIARRYAVDAIHLDYIRYVVDLERKLDFSFDPESLRQFGRDPKQEPAAWRRFKQDQVTLTVQTIRAAVRGARPGCRLTAAVFAPRAGRVKVFQDVETWVAQGLVDALYPMAYAGDAQEFARRLRESLPLGGKKVPVYPGIGVYKHKTPAMTLQQIEMAREAGARGFALFCYASFHRSADQNQLPEKDTTLRNRRIRALRELFR